MTYAELKRILNQNPDLSIVGDVSEGTVAQSIAVDVPVAVEIPRGSRAKRRDLEHQLQAAVIAKCEESAVSNPLYEMIFAIPNGGKRGKSVAGKLKVEGVKAGVLDLFISVARHGFHGYYLEIKAGDNKPTQKQLEWIRRFREQGYLCNVFWDDKDKIIASIEWYLEGDERPCRQ